VTAPVNGSEPGEGRTPPPHPSPLPAEEERLHATPSCSLPPWGREQDKTPPRGGRGKVSSLRTALSLLCVLPSGPEPPPDAAEVAGCGPAFPVAGLLLGALLGGLAALAGLLPPQPAAAAVLTAWVVLTGALHLDGFCDCCDGLCAGRSPDDRLRIMKDPHLGTFALAGGALLLLTKFAALAQLLQAHGPRAGWAVAAAVASARCLVMVVAAGARYPRPEGTGRLLIEATPARAALSSAAWAALVGMLAAPAVGVAAAAACTAGAGLAALAVRRACERRLGGVTGDGLGAAVELSEAALLWGAAVAGSLTPT
jgi:adenosylcobinamide-GDP ribazoletransferase